QTGDCLRAAMAESDRRRIAEPRTNTLENLFRGLIAWIVIGDHDAVGQPLCDFSHQRALAGITITAATEQTKQPAARVWTQRGEDFLQRIGGVCVVDHDQRMVAAT